MAKTLVIAEKPSVGPTSRACCPARSRSTRSRGQDRALARGPRARHHVGRRPPRPARRARRVRRQVQEVAHGRPADRARATSSSSCATSAPQKQMTVVATSCWPRRRRPGRQRVRRRPRGRADLRLPLREGQAKQAGPAAVAVLDDQRGDARGLRPRCATAAELGALRGRGPVALGGRLDRRHERHARGDDPAALVVRRRRLARAACRRRRWRSSRAARRRSAPSSPRRTGSSTPRFEADGRAPLRGPLPRRRQAAPDDRRRRPTRSSPPCAARRGEITKLDEDQAQGARAAALRPHVAAARGQHALRLHRPPHAGRRAALLRGAQGAHLSAHELALPDERHGRRRSSRSPGTSARRREYREAAAYVPALDLLPLGRVVDDAKVGDHHAIIPTNSDHDARQDERRRPPDLRPGGAALPRRLPSRGRVREHARGDDGRRAHLPHARQGAARARAGAASTASCPRATSAERRGRGRATSSCPRLRAAARPSTRARSRRSRRRPSRRGATPTRRCWAPWRPPASSSTTTSCARR